MRAKTREILIRRTIENKPYKLSQYLGQRNQKEVKKALVESFEKAEIGLTADYIAELIKDQIERLRKRQEESNVLEETWIDKSLREWVEIIVQLRGDINKGSRVGIVNIQQSKNEEYDSIITHYLESE